MREYRNVKQPWGGQEHGMQLRWPLQAQQRTLHHAMTLQLQDLGSVLCNRVLEDFAL